VRGFCCFFFFLFFSATIQNTFWNQTDNGKVTLEHGDVSWLQWLGMAIPFGLLCTAAVFAFLWLVYRPSNL